MNDPIKKPNHYQFEIAEVDDVIYVKTDVLKIIESLSKKMYEESNEHLSAHETHYLFSAVAYILRAPFKGSFKQDIQKAIFYLRLLVGENPRGS